jgi:Ca2+-binding RTX toxin-like protein
MRRLLLALGLGLAVVIPASASASITSPIKITFSSDTPGAQPNGFASLDSPNVTFYDTMGADLYLNDFGDQSDGQALSVHDDDASALEIRLTHPTTAISMRFGNDDPTVVTPTDQAQLTLYRNATQVAQQSVTVNGNDKMDQTIGQSKGPLFNRAVFQYVDGAGVPLNLIEIVDDIKVNPLCTVAGTETSNELKGTAGSDVICGGGGNDAIFGMGGSDVVYAGLGRDTVNGGLGRDVLLGGLGNDQLSGGRGADLLRGDVGNDTLAGGRGSDHCNGGPGKDRATGCEHVTSATTSRRR